MHTNHTLLVLALAAGTLTACESTPKPIKHSTSHATKLVAQAGQHTDSMFMASLLLSPQQYRIQGNPCEANHSPFSDDQPYMTWQWDETGKLVHELQSTPATGLTRRVLKHVSPTKIKVYLYELGDRIPALEAELRKTTNGWGRYNNHQGTMVGPVTAINQLGDNHFKYTKFSNGAADETTELKYMADGWLASSITTGSRASKTTRQWLKQATVLQVTTNQQSTTFNIDGYDEYNNPSKIRQGKSVSGYRMQYQNCRF